MIKSTRIVVKALTPLGRAGLAVQMEDEVALRDKYKDAKRKDVPLDVRSYLKTVSVYMPKGAAPVEHQILGFRRMNSYHKHLFYLGVKKAFELNGCSLKDWEVKFYDE